MAKLYYGNGNCSIEGSNIKGIEIRYTGKIGIEDKTPSSFSITVNENKIIIFPFMEGSDALSELFDYSGEFKILSIIVADGNAERVTTTINRVMDYSELLTSNAEDLTVISEDLKSTYKTGKKITKNIFDHNIIPDLHTSDWEGELYYKSGKLYEGFFHIHLVDSAAMTGKEHTSRSEDLYIKQKPKNRKRFKATTPTRNPSGVPSAYRLSGKKKRNLANAPSGSKSSSKGGY